MIPVDDDTGFSIAQRWCSAQGVGWSVLDTAGRGGTAPVFTVMSPEGPRAFKLLDERFSVGALGEETEKRIATQVNEIGIHDCPYLINIYDGGRFEGRLFILMNKAAGNELAKVLTQVPREKISIILDQVTQACLFLRGKGLCHRDIKSANIFVTEDFSHSTLLDLSVTRNIHDPIGIGTDYEGQLPVVATSRYSPPEYLFRLIPPSPELWHAVDIYQMGGLIHDLIMRSEMFENEYQLSRTNRYRFAWIVATKIPLLQAEDVDPALLLLARRALDKDWQRRSTLQLDAFLLRKESRAKLGLEIIGFGIRQKEQHHSKNRSLRNLVIEICDNLEEKMRSYQREKGITASHRSDHGCDDFERVVTFEWSVDSRSTQSDFRTFRLMYSVRCDNNQDPLVAIRADLSGFHENGKESKCYMDLPPMPVSPEIEDIVFSSCLGAISELAAKLIA